MARITLPVSMTLILPPSAMSLPAPKYDGSPMTFLARTVSPSEVTPVNLPSSPTSIESIFLLSM